MFKRFKRIALISSLIIGVSLVVTFPLLKQHTKMVISRSQQRGSHQDMYAKLIRPTADWVRRFYAEQGRLPTQEELNENNPVDFRGSYVLIYDKPRQGEPWGQPGKAFKLCVPISDWNLYYRSWDEKEIQYWTD